MLKSHKCLSQRYFLLEMGGLVLDSEQFRRLRPRPRRALRPAEAQPTAAVGQVERRVKREMAALRDWPGGTLVGETPRTEA